MARKTLEHGDREEIYPGFDGHEEPSRVPMDFTEGTPVQVGTAAPLDYEPISPNEKTGDVDIGDEEGGRRGRRKR